MNLKINGRNTRFFNQTNVVLKYDSIASTFSFNVQFDPQNPEHKNIFKPFTFNKVEIEHNSELLLTGQLIGNTFRSSAIPELANIRGYSLPGILEDCTIPTSLYPLQSIGLSLRQIAEKLIKPFNIKMVIDPAVKSRMDKTFKSSTADEKQSIKSYLCEKAAQKNILITHDELGRLVFTEAKTDRLALIDLDGRMPGLDMTLNADGQMMHSLITIIKQADEDGGNAGQSSITNPYSPIFRPLVKVQTSGSDIDTGDTAKASLSEELRGIVLTIKLDRWDINGKIIKPNNIINVINPDLYIYKKTKFLIDTVELTGDEKGTTSVLTCYLPEAFNSKTPINIFS